MRFKYMTAKAASPQPSLGGSLFRSRPVLAVRVTGPSGTSLRDGIVDTGADDTVFSEGTADSLGIDLSQTAPHMIGLAGRGLVPCRYAKVALRITDGRESHQWVAVVGFIPAPLHYVLLGHAGFLQYFNADFRGADRDFGLRRNKDFPGKSSRGRGTSRKA